MEKIDDSQGKHLLRQERMRHRWSQQDLADQLGTTALTVRRWERGSQQPGAYFRVKLCTLFGKSAEELGFAPDEPPVTSALQGETGVWSVPLPRNPFFTGRDLTLDQLHVLLANEPTIAALTQSYALSGLGGIGKTQLAIEYAYQHRSEYKGVFWVEAETQTSLISSFIRFARALALPEQTAEDQNKIVSAVLRWFNQHKGWLLLFDNVEDLSLIKPFLPTSSQGALLLTTRLQALGTLAQRVEIPPMNMQEGCDFLLARTNHFHQGKERAVPGSQERTIVEAIVTEMGGLPLALEQAGAYIDSTRCSFSEYLHIFRERQYHLLDEHELSDAHPLSVRRTFSLAFERVAQRHPLATNLLAACAFLAPDAIPETFFLEGSSLLGPAFRAITENPLAFPEAIKVLLSYSLIQRHSETQTLSVHRLVQVVLRERMSESERQGWRQRVLHQLSAVFPDGSYPTWNQCERLLPHVFACVTAISEDSKDLELAHLSQKTATYLYECGQQHEQAEELYQRALSIYEQVLGPQHLEVAASLYGLASLSGDVDQHKRKAEPLYERALSIYEQALGPQHPDVVKVLSSLARLSWKRGRYQEAERFAKRVVRIYEQDEEPEHSEMARALNGLALIYSYQGRYEEAEPIYQRALRIWEGTLGPDHPNVGATLNNLADLCQDQGRYEEAEPLYERALRIWEGALGLEHPDCATGYYNLASLFYKEGKDEEAQRLYERALQIWEQAFGPEHPRVARTFNGLANISRDQGHYEQAERLYQHALTIYQKYLSPPHPDIADLLYDLAHFHHLQQQTTEAVSIYQQALVMYEQTYGSQHPRTGETRRSLTLLLQQMSPKHEEAVSGESPGQER